MRVGSLFSGIGGLDLGLERAGMEVAWQVEIDPFRRRVLARHWPDVERHEDVRGVCVRREEHESGEGCPSPAKRGAGARTGQMYQRSLAPVDLICGGFPCQDLSVAGRRAGLHAARSGLFFEFARIVGEVRPAWFLLENVPGLLSSNEGGDFAVVLATMEELGYGVAWRILDSRYFGVPQRRRRVYIVGSLGDLRSAAVLFEPEGGAGDTAAGRTEGEGVAGTLGGGAGKRGWCDDLDRATYIAIGHGQGDPNFQEDEAYALDRGQPQQAVCTPPDADGVRAPTGVPRRVDVQAVSENQRGEVNLTDYSRQLTSGGGKPGQGYPAVLSVPLDPTDAKPCCPDGPRYAALGDAVTVNVAEWIGRRIMLVEGAG